MMPHGTSGRAAGAIAAAAVIGGAVGFLGAAAVQRGVPALAIAAGSAAASLAAAWAANGREIARVAREVELEEASLELRRSLYRLRKETRRAVRGSACDIGLQDLSVAALAIAAELNEARVMETALEWASRCLHPCVVAIHPHDRRTDRFERGIAIEDVTSRTIVAVAARGEDDALLRLALKHRRRLSRLEDATPEARAAFDAAEPSLVAVAPLFDRALACGVISVSGPLAIEGLPALDVLASTASLALSNARLRSAQAAAPVMRSDAHA